MSYRICSAASWIYFPTACRFKREKSVKADMKSDSVGSVKIEFEWVNQLSFIAKPMCGCCIQTAVLLWRDWNFRGTWHFIHTYVLVLHEVQYVDLETFVVKLFSWFVRTTKIKSTKYFLQRIITSTKNSYGQHIFTRVYRIRFPSAANWLFGVEWDGSFAIPAIEGRSPWPKRSSFFDNTSKGITEAKREVQEATSIGSKRIERGPYKRYSASVHAEVGKYASHHSVAAAARYFLKLNCRVSKTMVWLIRSSYAEGVRKRRAKDEGDIVALPLRKRGRPTTIWSRVGHKGVAVSEERQRRWRSSVGPNCKGSSPGHFTDVWSNQACRVWGSCGAQ